MLRYVALVREHKHVIISGPAGSGKSGMAGRLASAVSRRVQRLRLTREAGSVKGEVERLRMAGAECVILDNLEHAESLDTLLQELSAPGAGPQYIIGQQSLFMIINKCHYSYLLYAQIKVCFCSLYCVQF